MASVPQRLQSIGEIIKISGTAGFPCCTDKCTPVIAAKTFLKLRDQRIYMFQRGAGWQEYGIPAAAERLDQCDGGKRAVLSHRERRLLVGQQHGLGDDHGGEGDGAGLILIEKNIDLLLAALTASSATFCWRANMRIAASWSSTCWNAVRMVCR